MRRTHSSQVRSTQKIGPVLLFSDINGEQQIGAMLHRHQTLFFFGPAVNGRQLFAEAADI